MCLYTAGSGKKRSGFTKDGCATFFKKYRFSTVETHDVEFSHHVMDDIKNKTGIINLNANDSTLDESIIKRLLKDNVALICLLEETVPMGSKKIPNRLLVANTHIAASPELPDAKLWQTQTLVEWIQSLIQRYNQMYSSGVRCIIAGDFNSTPDSAVYELLLVDCLKLVLSQ
eukprot:Filipodium_phascolosomae@DN2395_c0_g1_i2.p1